MQYYKANKKLFVYLQICEYAVLIVFYPGIKNERNSRQALLCHLNLIVKFKADSPIMSDIKSGL